MTSPGIGGAGFGEADHSFFQSAPSLEDYRKEILLADLSDLDNGEDRAVRSLWRLGLMLFLFVSVFFASAWFIHGNLTRQRAQESVEHVLESEHAPA